MMFKQCFAVVISLGIWVPGFGIAGQRDHGDALYPIEQDGRWGYINNKGQVVVGPQFDYAWDFSEGIGRIEVKGKKGFIDKSGAMLARPEFDNAQDFSEGLAAVQKGYNFVYMYQTCRIAIEM